MAGKTKTPAAFSQAYPDATYRVIEQTNYLDWIGG